MFLMLTSVYRCSFTGVPSIYGIDGGPLGNAFPWHLSKLASGTQQLSGTNGISEKFNHKWYFISHVSFYIISNVSIETTR